MTILFWIGYLQDLPQAVILTNPYYDTLVTARRLLPRQRRGIEALAEKFGIKHNTLHRAMEDVEVNRQIFKRIDKA